MTKGEIKKKVEMEQAKLDNMTLELLRQNKNLQCMSILQQTLRVSMLQELLDMVNSSNREVFNYVFYTDYDDHSTAIQVVKTAKALGLECDESICTNDMVSRREFVGFCKQYTTMVRGERNQIDKFIVEANRFAIR